MVRGLGGLLAAVCAVLGAVRPAVAGIAAPGGVVVAFRADTPDAERDALHGALGTRLAYRARAVPHDWVIPAGPIALDEKALQALCGRYARSYAVRACTPNYAAVAFRAAAPPGGGAGHAGAGEGARAVDAEPTVACHPPRLVDTHGLPLLRGGTLSPLWAQEAIGVDLVREEASALKGARRASIGVADMGFYTDSLKGEVSSDLQKSLAAGPKELVGGEATGRWPGSPEPPGWDHEDERVLNLRHGTLVANLAGSGGPFGAGVLGKLDVVGLASTGPLAKTTDEMVRRRPDLMNLSVGYHNPETYPVVLASLKKIADNGTIIVAASGNDHPSPMNDVDQKLAGIVVGSLGPEGVVSGFSQEGEKLTILAPSDDWLLSMGKGGEVTKFGGTSGAAPLVTGALANAISFLPGLGLADARKLLEKTAIPNRHSKESPRRNGAGALNAYLLFRVAQRLAAAWPTNREKLADPSTYDFTSEAERLREEAVTALASGDCDKQQEGFAKLRRAFFLAPGDRALATLVASWYGKQKLDGNAAYFTGLGASDETLARLFAKETGAPEKFRVARGLLGAARALGAGALPLVEKALERPEKETRFAAVNAALATGAPGIAFLQKRIPSLDEETQSFLAIQIAREHPEKAVPVLRDIYLFAKGARTEEGEKSPTGGPPSSVRGAVLYALGYAKGDHSPVWDLALRDGDPKLLEVALEAELRTGAAPALARRILDEGKGEALGAAIARVAKLARPPDGALIERLLLKESEAVAKGALHSLEMTVDLPDGALAKLLDGAAARSPALALAAIPAAAYARPPATALLKKLYDVGGPDVKAAALFWLGGTSPEGKAALAAAVTSADAKVAAAAAGVAGRLGKDGRAYLTSLAAHADPAVRAAVAKELPRDAGEALYGKLLADPAPEVRQRAAQTLAQHGVDRGALKKALASSDPAVRAAVLDGRWDWTDADLPLLKAALDDPSGAVRAALFRSRSGSPLQTSPAFAAHALAHPQKETRLFVWNKYLENLPSDGFKAAEKAWGTLSPADRVAVLAGASEAVMESRVALRLFVRSALSGDAVVSRAAAMLLVRVLRRSGDEVIYTSDVASLRRVLEEAGATAGELARVRE